jgi:hypothetical protein
MPKPKIDREGDARLRGLIDRVGERASDYFPELDAGVRVDVRARWRRVYSDVYRLAIGGGAREAKEVVLKICGDAEIQHRAMVAAWPQFAQHQTLKIPRPLDYFPEGPAIVMEAVKGQSLQERLPFWDCLGHWSGTGETDCHRAGQWLRFYHGPGPLAEGHLEADSKVEDFESAVRKLTKAGVVGRHGGDWVRQLRGDGETVRSRLLPIARVHGDFTIDNVLLDGPRVTGLDVWSVHTNAIYHDIASFLNSIELLRLTRLLSSTFLSHLRSAFLDGYFAGEQWDELALTFLQRVGLVDVALEIYGRRPSFPARLVLKHVMEAEMRMLAKRATGRA